jgi:D-xylose transport system ATP-binding protein
MAVDESSTPLLEARGIQKRFGSVVALRGADLELHKGEVHALVGDNGAGKSTFIKVLSGVLTPDGGDLFIDGQAVTLNGPQAAMALGIETVYQDLALAGHLDAAANLFLGRELRYPGVLGQLGFLNKPAMRQRTIQEMRHLKINLKSVEQPVNSLSGGQRQAVAVARAVTWGRSIVILDEPTAALGVEQTAQVLDLVERLRERGHAVILISHNMADVKAVADKVAVLRLGRNNGVFEVKSTSQEEIISAITGATDNAVTRRAARTAGTNGEVSK